MLIHGCGTSGLAIVGLQATERDAYSKKPLRGHPMVWQAIPKSRMDTVLCCTLFGYCEPLLKGQLAERGEAFLAECQAKNIRTIVAVGSRALRAVSPVSGKIVTLVGSTITSGAVPYIIPVDTHWGGYRAFRAYAWVRAMTRFVKRGLALAEGKGSLYEFPSPVIGDCAASLRALERIYDEKLPVGNDIETTGKDWRTDKITAMGLANSNVAVSVPWQAYTSRRHGPQVGLQCDRIRRAVEAILSDERITKIFHNGMFDLSVLGLHGVKVAGPIEDTYLAHKIVYPDLFHNLQFCLANEHAVAPWKTLFNMSRKERREGDDWADTEPVPLMVYNAQDAAAELPLWDRLAAKLEALPRGWENYRNLMQLGELAADMQGHGVRIDLAARNALAAQTLDKIADVTARWEAETDTPLSGEGSTKGIEQLLFVKLRAPVVSLTKKNRAQLNSSALLEYASMHETNPKLARAAWLLFEFRKIKKTYDAFLKPLTQDRVYARPNPAGTRGSRFSYSEPNLQQWSKEKTVLSPITKEEVILAPSLRHLVCADEGYVLGEHDYNALEVRLLAYAAGVEVWLDWLRRGLDMHSEHAALMFGRRVGKGDPLRQVTKVLTFARFYNRKRSVGMVLKALKPSMPTLTEVFLTEVFRRFDAARPEIVAWQDSVEAFVRANGYVELPLSGMRQWHDRERPDINAALSYGIQSTGGDIINPAALRIRPRLDASRGERILLNVHDALLWQAKAERVSYVSDVVAEEMERPVMLWGHTAIFPTECKVGPNWRDLVPYRKVAA